MIAIDINPNALQLAKTFGAEITLNAEENSLIVERIIEITERGVHVSFDALGNPRTCVNSVRGLRKRGRHVQVGLLLNEESTPAIPMDIVLANELQIYGSHGIQAFVYQSLLGLILADKIDPKSLIQKNSFLLRNRLLNLKK